MSCKDKNQIMMIYRKELISYKIKIINKYNNLQLKIKN